MRGRRVGFFLYAKRRLSLAELYYCFETLGEINALLAAERRLAVFFELKKLILLLTTRKRFVFFWDLFSIDKLFEVYGMKKSNSESVENPADVKERLLLLGAQLAAQTGGTAWEKLSNLTTEEIVFHTDAVLREKLEMWRNFAMAYHAPKEFMNYLQETQNYLSRRDLEQESPASLQDRIRKAIERSPNRNRKVMPHHASTGALGLREVSKTRGSA